MTYPRVEARGAREGVLESYRGHLGVGMARLLDLLHANVETRSAGAHVWDDRGEKYLECGGYGVFLLGHCHPRVVDAVIAQVRSHPLSTHVLLNPALAEAAEALVRVTPDGLDQIYFGVSGAEAVETGLKLARMHDRRRIIAMQNSYHGTTFGAVSVTGGAVYRAPFFPLLPDVEFVPFGRADALAEALANGPEACVLLEPVQGDAGVVVPPDGYLSKVESLCQEHGAFLIFDEIQTGLGRLGTWWGADLESVRPDVLLTGKSLSGGVVPVSAMVASESAFQPLGRDPLVHASTFSGSPIAMAAVKATIEAIEEEDLVSRAGSLGPKLREMIASILEETCPSLVRDVRGAGLMLAIEWEADYIALDFMIEMLDRRVITSHSMNATCISRLLPPAILADDDIDWLADAVRASAKAVAGR